MLDFDEEEFITVLATDDNESQRPGGCLWGLLAVVVLGLLALL